MQESQRTPARRWQVLLIGGASGSGKTSVSYRLAHHFGIGITEADDIHCALMRMTTPEQQPALHYWQTHPEAQQWPAEEILQLFLASCHALAPALEAVIANHLESDVPLVLEGDYILPALATLWIRRRVAEPGCEVVPARPWANSFERILKLLA